MRDSVIVHLSAPRPLHLCRTYNKNRCTDGLITV